MNYNIDIIWDEEAQVWCAICDDIPLALENSSFDTLIQRVKTTAHEILELNGKLTKDTHCNMAHVGSRLASTVDLRDGQARPLHVQF